MKRVTLALLLLCSITTFAQDGINYKALIKDNLGAVVASQSIDVRFTIIADTGATPVYSENHTGVLTDANGIVIVSIGGGSVLTGVFADIAWGSDTHSLKVEIDIEQDGSFVDMGTTQFMSVPYAIHAQTASNGQSSGTTAGEMQYWNGAAWVTVAPGSTGQVLTYVNGVPSWGGSVSAGTGEVQNPVTGAIWMDRNLGASQVATIGNDAASYGDLYQWGRAADGHQLRTSGTRTTLSSSDTPGHSDFITTTSSPFDWRSPQNGTLWQGVNGVNNPCPAGYRLPTDTELNNEQLSWSTNNAAGAFASPLKLPVAGYRNYSSGSLSSVGSLGSYWSSAVNGTLSRYLYFFSGFANMSSTNRAFGFSVRCIKE
jgi:uncharacterized protein (TIGR02145 family)